MVATELVDNNNFISKLIASKTHINFEEIDNLKNNNAIAVVISSRYDQSREIEENRVLISKNKIIVRIFLTQKYAYIRTINSLKEPDLNDFLELLSNNQEFHDTIIFQKNDVFISWTDDYIKTFVNYLSHKITSCEVHNVSKNNCLTVFDINTGTVQSKELVSKTKVKGVFIKEEHNLFHSCNIKTDKNTYRLKNSIDFNALEKKIIDSEFGIAKHSFYVVNSKYFPMFSIEAMLNGTSPNNAYGRDLNFLDSKHEALLETLERFYNSSDRQNRMTVHDSYNNLREYAVNPDKLILHSTQSYENPEFNYQKYTPNSICNWLWAWSIKYKKYVLIPSQYFHYHDSSIKESKERFIYECSNGAALGSTQEEALLYSIFETIERDNFLACFYNKLKLNAISLSSLTSQETKRILRLINVKGYKIYLFDISLELEVPAVWCLCINENNGAVVKTYSAAGCNFNPEKAVLSALVEVITSISVYEEVFNKPDQLKRRKLLVKNTERVTLFEDHVLYYSSEEAKKNFDYLLKDINYKAIENIYPNWYTKQTFDASNLNDDLKKLIRKIFMYYEDIYFADLSDDFLIDFKLHCTKALIPGMLSMTFGIQHQRISFSRLNNARIFAYEKKQIRSLGSNVDVPHPFP